MNTGINEHNLRELAYRIWEAEGCPPGQAERHWQMALEQAGLEQETYTTGESFLGEALTSENLVQDERQYALQNNPFQEEVTQTVAGTKDAQQQLDAQQPAKASKRGKGSKTKNNETLATQNLDAGSGKSRKNNSSENILV